MTRLPVVIAAWLLAILVLLHTQQPEPSGSTEAVASRSAAVPPPAPAASGLDVPAIAHSVASADEPALVRLRGRCVDEHELGCAAVVQVAGPERLTTRCEADGAFELQLPNDWLTTATQRRPLLLHAEAVGRSRVTLRLPGTAPSALTANAHVRDVGTLHLPIAAAFTVLVHTSGGAPVAGCRVRFQRTADGDESGAVPSTECIVTTDAFGGAVAEGLAAASPWHVRVDEAWSLRTPRAAFVPAELAAGQLEIVVADSNAEDELAGVLRDANGAPLAGAQVLARKDDEAPFASTLSDADGRFRLQRAAGAPALAMLCVPDVAGHERLRAGPFAFGTRALELRLQRPPPRRLRVVASDGSGEVARFGWSWTTEGGEVVRRGEGAVAPREGGVAVLDDVPSEAVWLDVLTARDDPFAAKRRVLVAATAREIVVGLPRHRRLDVQLRTRDGAALGGSRIEAVVDGAVVDTVVTDAHGAAQLALAAGNAHVHVRATGSHLPAYADVRPGAERIALVAAGGGEVTGALTPRSMLDELRRAGGGAGGIGLGVRARLVDADGDDRTLLVEVGGDGRFACRHVPSGRWLLVVDCHLALPGGALLRHELVRAPVAVLEATTSRVDVDLGSNAPGAVDLVVAGATAATEVRLCRADEGEPIADLRTGVDGTLRVPNLPPGDYRAATDDGRAARFQVIAGHSVPVTLGGDR